MNQLLTRQSQNIRTTSNVSKNIDDTIGHSISKSISKTIAQNMGKNLSKRISKNIKNDRVKPTAPGQSEVFSHMIKTDDELSESFELIKILRLYQQTNRWTLLIAPQNIPDKALLDCCSVDMDRVLVVREKQIDSVLATIENALSHATCSAVVAWCNNINSTKMAEINQLAENSECHFYAFNKRHKALVKNGQSH